MVVAQRLTPCGMDNGRKKREKERRREATRGGGGREGNNKMGKTDRESGSSYYGGVRSGDSPRDSSDTPYQTSM